MDPTSHVELKCYLFIYFCDRTKEEFATQRMNEKGGESNTLSDLFDMVVLSNGSNS